MRMRMDSSVSRGSMWMSLARSVMARSMMAFTRRMAGAWLTESSPTWLPAKALSTAAVASPEAAASRFISSMALAAPSLPYSTCMARSTADDMATMGTTLRRAALRTSSMA